MSATQTPKENPVCTYLQKRANGVYYFRRRVPDDLREFFGKREFQESLGTKDRQEAVRLCRKRSIITGALFDRVRGEMRDAATIPTDI